jgi:hypothetical protein
MCKLVITQSLNEGKFGGVINNSQFIIINFKLQGKIFKASKRTWSFEPKRQKII